MALAGGLAERTGFGQVHFGDRPVFGTQRLGGTRLLPFAERTDSSAFTMEALARFLRANRTRLRVVTRLFALAAAPKKEKAG